MRKPIQKRDYMIFAGEQAFVERLSQEARKVQRLSSPLDDPIPEEAYNPRLSAFQKSVLELHSSIFQNRKEDFEVGFYAEEVNIEEYYTGIHKIGNAYFYGYLGLFGYPVYAIFYFDSANNLRLYVPKDGNVFNFKTKMAFGGANGDFGDDIFSDNGDKVDEQVARMVYKMSLEELMEGGVEHNREKMFDDIRRQFGIAKCDA